MSIWHVNGTPLGDRQGLIIGILNTGPESFFDGDTIENETNLVRRALTLYDDGADIVEVGGQTTRPGYKENGLELTVESEVERTIPIIEAIKLARPDALVAIDTYKYEVMVAAIKAGVDIINDVNGFADDPRKLPLIATSEVGILTMWNPRGKEINDVKNSLFDWAVENLSVLEVAGVNRNRILIDPGIGYAKDSRVQHDLAIMRHVDVLQELNRPVLVAVSNKGWAGQLLGLAKRERTAISLVAAQSMMQSGARVLRVHDVKETRNMLRLLAEIES
ncbi:dihydropteroate synthase [Weissella confusa]|uniref:dihydropteroate synthase n=1 Tax=Weissella confusa TaxID=1583 RepID=UPI0035A3C4AE